MLCKNYKEVICVGINPLHGFAALAMDTINGVLGGWGQPHQCKCKKVTMQSI